MLRVILSRIIAIAIEQCTMALGQRSAAQQKDLFVLAEDMTRLGGAIFYTKRSRLLNGARYKHITTPKKRDMRARLRLVGRLISPLQGPIDVKFKIGAAANSGFAIGFSLSRSCRGSV